jgi:hypothetical protein
MTKFLVDFYDSAGEARVHAELPGRKCICPDCDGEGTVLNEAMRHHAYTSEEFDEEFGSDYYDGGHEDGEYGDDEYPIDSQAGQYFKRGGIYDVPCPTCKGNKITVEIDREACEQNSKYKQILEQYDEYQNDLREFERECAAERSMGA